MTSACFIYQFFCMSKDFSNFIWINISYSRSGIQLFQEKNTHTANGGGGGGGGDDTRKKGEGGVGRGIWEGCEVVYSPPPLRNHDIYYDLLLSQLFYEVSLKAEDCINWQDSWGGDERKWGILPPPPPQSKELLNEFAAWFNNKLNMKPLSLDAVVSIISWPKRYWLILPATWFKCLFLNYPAPLQNWIWMNL